MEDGDCEGRAITLDIGHPYKRRSNVMELSWNESRCDLTVIDEIGEDSACVRGISAGEKHTFRFLWRLNVLQLYVDDQFVQTFVVDNVSNWFVRLSKKRFWGGEMTTDKLSAYQTLYTCLETVARLMAPIAPYYADRLYRDLHEGRGEAEVRSVHLAKFPVADTSIIDVEQEERMALAQQITSMIHSLRKKEAISVKQPLQRIAIPALNTEQQQRIEAMKQLILDEVNVKEIEFVEGAGMLVKKVKCNFRTMGKKFGKQMKAVAAAVSAMGQEQISMLEQGSVTLCVEGVDALIELEDVEIYS